jgi:dTDP-glucose 4,6-dehydratase
LLLLNAIEGKPLPIYGDGSNVRDWLYVEDHCHALCVVLEKGHPGELYNVGGRAEKSNLEVVNAVCEALEQEIPAQTNPGFARSEFQKYSDLITFVKDRPGHDQRYAIDPTKIESELGWQALETFESGLQKTIQWYLNNAAWCDLVRGQEHEEWIKLNYDYRLGSRS